MITIEKEILERIKNSKSPFHKLIYEQSKGMIKRAVAVYESYDEFTPADEYDLNMTISINATDCVDRLIIDCIPWEIEWSDNLEWTGKYFNCGGSFNWANTEYDMQIEVSDGKIKVKLFNGGDYNSIGKEPIVAVEVKEIENTVHQLRECVNSSLNLLYITR